jgi:PIN domain nuclease of toxin-antitoxin system
VDQSQAIFVGRLHSRLRRHGISLGDSFCLALAQQAGRPVLTADRKWKELETVLGIEVSLIR